MDVDTALWDLLQTSPTWTRGSVVRCLLSYWRKSEHYVLGAYGLVIVSVSLTYRSVHNRTRTLCYEFSKQQVFQWRSQHVWLECYSSGYESWITVDSWFGMGKHKHKAGDVPIFNSPREFMRRCKYRITRCRCRQQHSNSQRTRLVGVP